MTDRDHADMLLITSCATALATLLPVTLYQTGVLKKLSDPPGKFFASEMITSSKQAYPLDIPDGLLGLASYGTTMALAIHARKSPVSGKLLGAKLALDCGMAGFNVVRQVVSFRKLCSWCTGTAIATFVMVYAGRRVITAAAGSLEEVVSSRRRNGLGLRSSSGDVE